jgi:flavin reductase (DIM6/NTAB) family NADH-FMN oxidoreductase RutF
LANRVEVSLISSIYDLLQKERFVTISTIDHVTSGPNVAAISWVYAPDSYHVLLAVDNRSRIVENIKNHRLVVLNLFANESTYSISGEATVKNEKIEGDVLRIENSC